MQSIILKVASVILLIYGAFATHVELNTDYRVSNLNRSFTFDLTNAQGSVQLDVSLASAGSTPDTKILFPGALDYKGSLGEFMIPENPPWDIIFREIDRKNPVLSFTRTACPFGNASQRPQGMISVSGSPERTGNAQGEVSFRVSNYPLGLTKGRLVSNSMGRGIMYHTFEVESGSSPTHIRFATYPRGPMESADLGALTYLITRESCPSFQQEDADDADSDKCTVRLQYNKDTTLYNLTVNFDADSRNPPELAAYLPEGFFSTSEWSSVEAYGADLSGFHRANRFLLMQLRPDESKTPNRGEPKSRSVQGVLLKAFSKDNPEAKDFGIFSLNGRPCRMKTFVTNRKGLVVSEFKSSDYRPSGFNDVGVFRANARDGIYTLGSGDMNLPAGRYVLAFKWNNPSMKLDYELGIWSGSLAPSIQLDSSKDGQITTKQDIPFMLPFTISDSAGENRQFVELNLRSSAGMRIRLNRTISGLAVVNSNYRPGDFVREFAVQGSINAIMEAIRAVEFQSDEYYSGKAKLEATLVDKSCFYCRRVTNITTMVKAMVNFEKIEHAPEFDFKAEELNILEGQTELNISNFVDRIRSVDGSSLPSSANVRVSMRFEKSPMFRTEPQLITSNQSNIAHLYAAFGKEMGQSRVCVKVEQPSLETPGTMLQREKCGQIERHPVKGCDLFAKPSLLFVSQLGMPSMLNLTLTCRPYDIVHIPLKVSDKKAAILSIPQTNFTLRQWRSRLVAVRGTPVNKSTPFEITIGPLETHDVRYRGKTATFQLWNRDNADDCADNKDAWWCAEYQQSSDATSFRLGFLSLILASIVGFIFIR